MLKMYFFIIKKTNFVENYVLSVKSEKLSMKSDKLSVKSDIKNVDAPGRL